MSLRGRGDRFIFGRGPNVHLSPILVALALVVGAAHAADAPPARVATPAAIAGELAALRGKVVMLNVWATWCSPCLREIPDLLAVEADLAAQGFVLLGLSVDEAVEAPRVDEFRRKYFPAFRTLVRDAPDMDAAVSAVDPAWNELVPTTYLIGRDGKVLQRIQGKKTRAEFRAAAEAALAAR